MLFMVGAAVVAATACGSNNPPPSGGEQAGSTCASAATCYPDVKDQTQIKGAVTCLTKVPDGYCTHLCKADTDCCAVPGECRTGLEQVCSPFENQPESYCFLSCEDPDVKAAGYADANVYCQTLGNAAFTCRSTGGGASNRKICSI